MTEFQMQFTKSQQFLLLQAYADRILSEPELMNFLLLEDHVGEPIIITSEAVYLLQPAPDFAAFSHRRYDNAQWHLTGPDLKAGEYQLHLTDPQQAVQLTLAFAQQQEAESLLTDLARLFQGDEDK